MSKKFYIDERKENKGLRITDEFSKLTNIFQAINLPKEVEYRWFVSKLIITVYNIFKNQN